MSEIVWVNSIEDLGVNSNGVFKLVSNTVYIIGALTDHNETSLQERTKRNGWYRQFEKPNKRLKFKSDKG